MVLLLSYTRVRYAFAYNSAVSKYLEWVSIKLAIYFARISDTLQTFIMIGGSIFLTAVSFREVGGYSSMLEQYGKAVAALPPDSNVNQSCAQPPEVENTKQSKLCQRY